jgi:hypothetical protein
MSFAAGHHWRGETLPLVICHNTIALGLPHLSVNSSWPTLPGFLFRERDDQQCSVENNQLQATNVFAFSNFSFRAIMSFQFSQPIRKKWTWWSSIRTALRVEHMATVNAVAEPILHAHVHAITRSRESLACILLFSTPEATSRRSFPRWPRPSGRHIKCFCVESCSALKRWIFWQWMLGAKVRHRGEGQVGAFRRMADFFLQQDVFEPKSY